jgi:hypothetical protein
MKNEAQGQRLKAKGIAVARFQVTGIRFQGKTKMSVVRRQLFVATTKRRAKAKGQRLKAKGRAGDTAVAPAPAGQFY